MKSVTQKHGLGCGAACVAFILEKPYDDIINQLGLKAAETKGFGCQKLCKLLSTGQDKYRFKKFTPKLQYLLKIDGVLVFIKRSKIYPYGHYFARMDGSWMDPWINLQTEKHIESSQSGFRIELPGEPEFILFPSKQEYKI